MKQIIFTIDDSKKLDQLEGNVEINGRFEQDELNALIHVIAVYARQMDMDLEYMIDNILSDDEIESVIGILLHRYKEQHDMDIVAASEELS